MYYFGKDYILMSKFVLIDGHSILNRAFYGVPIFTNSEGLHTNAVFGFLNIMFKQLKNLKEEEPHLFYQSLLLMDIGKSPDSLAVNEEVALKMTADYMVDEENKPKKKNEPKFHISQDSFIKKYDDIKNDDSIMAELFESADVKDDGFSLN